MVDLGKSFGEFYQSLGLAGGIRETDQDVPKVRDDSSEREGRELGIAARSYQ